MNDNLKSNTILFALNLFLPLYLTIRDESNNSSLKPLVLTQEKKSITTNLKLT